jgi:hypothetical protein
MDAEGMIRLRVHSSALIVVVADVLAAIRVSLGRPWLSPWKADFGVNVKSVRGCPLCALLVKSVVW